MNSQTLRPVRRRLEGISPRTWEHPADRAALTALRSIPGFDEVLKKIFSIIGERGARLAFQGDAVRVSPRQFARFHRLWLDVQDTLDAGDEYELYITYDPAANAGAFGLDKPWVVLQSGALSLLTDDEISFVMGHELGHVLSGHALYHTMMVILIMIARAGMPVLGLAIMPIILALREWYRKSEVSGDRAGLLACQLPDAAMGAMMRFAGGGKPEDMNLYEFLQQAEEYRKTDGLFDQVMKVLNTLGRSHPYLVVRAALMRDWIEEGAYDRILRGEYPRRGDGKPDVMEDLGAGLRHYTGSAEDAAGKAGETLRRMRDAFDRGFGKKAE